MIAELVLAPHMYWHVCVCVSVCLCVFVCFLTLNATPDPIGDP